MLLFTPARPHNVVPLHEDIPMSVSQPDSARTVNIDVISDVVCPWCYIGKHRLEQGLAKLETNVDIEVRWRPFELNPTMPKEGMDREIYCERKFGSIERARQLYANVAANAEADGLPMAVERIARMPNTRPAHRLIGFAEERGKQNDVVDALFAAYFIDGRDIGDHVVLLEIATAVGLDSTEIDGLLNDDAADELIEAQEREADAMGVHGVPAFLINGSLLFSGAQDPTTVALAISKGL